MEEATDAATGAAGAGPLGDCPGCWPGLFSVEVASDVVTTAAALAVAVLVVVFLRKAPAVDPRLRRGAVLLAAFLCALALTHLAALVAIGAPVGWMPVLPGAATAVLLFLLALAVWPLAVRVAPATAGNGLEAASAHRARQEAERDAAIRGLEVERDALRREVAERTHELQELRQLFEAATSGGNITVFAQTRDLTYTWIHNPRLGFNADEVVGKSDLDILPALPARDEIIGHKRRVVETGTPETFEIELPEGTSTSWFRVNVTAFTTESGRVDGVVSTAIDITRAKRLDEMRQDLSARLATTVQRFNLALRASDVFVFSQDADLRYTWTNVADGPFGALVGRTDAEVFDNPLQAEIRSLKRAALETGEARTAEIRMATGDTARWFALSVEREDRGDRPSRGIVGVALDITDRKSHEHAMRLAMRELTHRSKNLLTVVQAIARQTARTATGVDTFVESFGDRLRALAGAQDLLVESNWHGARLSDVVRGQIGHYLRGDGARIIVEGPDLDLSPEATQTLGLAMHELATNAAKYGALSNEAGIVRVVWEIETDEDGTARLRLEWRESGGPQVGVPSRRGFGTLVVERNVAQSLSAEVDLDFAPDGLVATFLMPVEALTAESATPESADPAL